MGWPRHRALLLAGVLLLWGGPCAAVAGAQPPHPPAGPAATADDAARTEVRWHDDWSRFRTWQWVVTPTLLAGSLALRYLGPQPSGRWTGGILFDDAVDDALAVRSDPARRRLVLATDLHVYGSLALLVADAVVTAGLVHHRWDVALQMALIDLQSVAVVMATLWSTQLLASRARPYERFCDDSGGHPDIVRDCEANASERGRSFIAGHTAIVMTAAGLTCMHHGHMPLFGGGVADSLFCGVLVAAAGLNGLARVATENHYATDAILGLGLGVVAGWLLPAALHYGLGGDPAGPAAAIAPTPLDGGGGLVVSVVAD